MTHFYLWLCVLWLITFQHFLPSKHACNFQCWDVRQHYQFKSFHNKTENRAFCANFKKYINRGIFHSDSASIFGGGFVLLMESSEQCFVQFKIYISLYVSFRITRTLIWCRFTFLELYRMHLILHLIPRDINLNQRLVQFWNRRLLTNNIPG